MAATEHGRDPARPALTRPLISGARAPRGEPLDPAAEVVEEAVLLRTTGPFLRTPPGDAGPDW